MMPSILTVLAIESPEKHQQKIVLNVVLRFHLASENVQFADMSLNLTQILLIALR